MTDTLPGDPTDPLALEIRPAPLGVPTYSGRRLGRERRVLRSGAAFFANQALSAACTLVTVPIAVRRLSADEFGVWITLSSLIILLGFLDFGIGNALVGAVARAQAAGDRNRVQEMISSAFVGLAAVAAGLGGAFWVISPHVPWASILGVDSPVHSGEVARSVAIVVAGILASLPLSVAAQAQSGLQEGHTVVLWRSIGNVIQLLAVVVLFLTHGTLAWFITAMIGGPVLGSLLNSITLFSGRRKWLHPSRRKASAKVFRRLGSTGFLFFVLLIAGTVAYQSDALVIAHFLGSTAAGKYGVPFRLFMFVPNLVSAALMPLWPAYADAWEIRDVEWIRKTFRRSLVFALSANGAIGLVLVFAARRILQVWVGDAVNPSNVFLAALFCYVIVWGVSGPVAMLFNGCHVVKFQIAVSITMAAVNLPLSIALLSPLGVAGPLVGTVVAQTLIVLVPAFVFMRRLLRPLTSPVAL